MKWFLALLVLLAAGVAAAALSVPTNAVVVNGTAISQGSLNSDLTAIAASPSYQCYVNSQAYLSSNGQQQLPPVSGAGKSQDADQHPTATSSFTATYIDLTIQHELIAAAGGSAPRGGDPGRPDPGSHRLHQPDQPGDERGPADAGGAEPSLHLWQHDRRSPASRCCPPCPPAFVDEQVQFVATTVALEEKLAGAGSSDAGLMAYFERHRSEFDTVCVTVASYASESDAKAAASQVAARHAVPTGGPAGTGPAGLPEPVRALGAIPRERRMSGSLPVGGLSAPIPVSSGYVLVQVTSRTPSDFSAAKPFVTEAAQQAGENPAAAAVSAVQRHADVSVDPRYGVWVPATAQVFTPFVPEPSDVLNPTANSTVASTSTSLSGG